MQNSRPILTLTVIAAGAIAANHFVTPAGAQAGAAANTYGVSRTDAVLGDPVPVDVMGTAIVQTGGVIAAGGLVEVDANGCAVAHNAGAIVGRLAPGESSSGAGQLVELILLPN